MKMNHFVVGAMLLGASVLPFAQAETPLEKACVAASVDSKASLSLICQRTYEAVLATPDKADEVFEQVLAQRTSWKSNEVYAIFRAVLLARPDLEVSLNNYVVQYKGGKNGKDGKDGVSREGMDPMVYRLMNVLYQASLAEGVAETVINALTNPPHVPPVDTGLNTNKLPSQELEEIGIAHV